MWRRFTKHLPQLILISLIFPTYPLLAATEQADASLSDFQWGYPKKRSSDRYDLIIHAPQITQWRKFKQFEALIAVEVIPSSEVTSDEKIVSALAHITVGGTTQVLMNERVVLVTEPSIQQIQFVHGESEDIQSLLKQSLEREELVIPVDLFLEALVDEIIPADNTNGLSLEPPKILVTATDSVLLFVNGEPKLEPIDATSLSFVSNANWPLLFSADTSIWYLKINRSWLEATSLAASWQRSTSLPPQIEKIDVNNLYYEILFSNDEDSKRQSTNEIQSTPQIILAVEPTELIVTQGEIVKEMISESSGLSFISNTQSPLFHYDDKYYFLTSGRWFLSDDLKQWKYAQPLPPAFTKIPKRHGMAFVRVSIPGTVESRLAILEATLPEEKSVDKLEPLDLKIEFDGAPIFEAIPATQVSRISNSAYNIIKFKSDYYLCYAAAWYLADEPAGPYFPAEYVPQEIYKIPASSPSYPVTDVTITQADQQAITYSHTQAYSSNVYISYGVPVYGTGWYYPPYYGLYYYPYFMSYGYGSYYNPNTGRYTTRSARYGPYGGYSYNRFSNTETGRNGYVETAWDNDQWAGYGESYNPRTDTYSEVSGYYNDDNERLELERESYRNGNSISTDRTIDFNDGWSSTTRQTSNGAASQMDRQRQADGSITSQGSVTAADGRTANISGSYQDGDSSTSIAGSQGGQGDINRSRDGDAVTRDGSYTNKEGDSVSSNTQRQGDQSRTELASSKGGEAISLEKDGQRGTVARDHEGNLYASKDGNVYKKQNDSWYEYSGGNKHWQEIQSQRSGSANALGSQNKDWSSSAQQLERDAKNRQNSYNRYNQRRAQPRTGGMRAGRFR